MCERWKCFLVCTSFLSATLPLPPSLPPFLPPCPLDHSPHLYALEQLVVVVVGVRKVAWAIRRILREGGEKAKKGRREQYCEIWLVT